MSQPSHSAEQFADAVGRSVLARSVGVGLSAVSNAIERGKFPASWYEAGKELAASVNVECPPGLFGQKKPLHSQNVNAARKCKSPAKKTQKGAAARKVGQ
jgi:hypothetical protein